MALRAIGLLVILLVSVMGTILAQVSYDQIGAMNNSYAIFLAIGSLLLAAGLVLRNCRPSTHRRKE
jgi:ABC-type Na+ efflux pump permease subunit